MNHLRRQRAPAASPQAGGSAPSGDAARARRPRVGPPAALAALIAVLSLAVAACVTGAATVPPDATGSAAPPATATPPIEPSSGAASFPVTLTDDEGSDVTLDAAPRRGL